VPAEEIAHPLALSQTGGHGVDALPQEADLAGVVHDHPDRVVAVADPLHRPAQVAQRLPHRPRGQQRGQAADEQGDDDEEDHRTPARPPGVARVEVEQHDAEHRHAAGEPPGQQQPGPTPRVSTPAGGWAERAMAVTLRAARATSR
jgi:hypothetical protein